MEYSNDRLKQKEFLMCDIDKMHHSQTTNLILSFFDKNTKCDSKNSNALIINKTKSMSFETDLESIQKQIEDLDDGVPSQKGVSDTSSLSSGESRIRELEEKAQKLTRMIKRRVEILSPGNQYNVSPVVIKKVRSHDENTKLRKKLSNLENEIQELTQKEMNWLSTTKNVQSQVKSLRSQIDKLKHQNRSRTNDQKSSSKKSVRDQSFFKATPSAQRNEYVTSTKDFENGIGAKINIHSFQRLQRVNQQLMRDNQNLKSNITKIANKSLAEQQHLKVRLTERETEVNNLKQQMENTAYALRDEQHRITDLQQQSLVLQQAVENYDQLKEEDNKLQLEYQRSLQNVLQARKDKSLIEQKLNAALNQIQEMEINCRQLNHEKMSAFTALSEMRAMKNVFEQERKNVADRYERIVQKLEAEMSYTKQNYQEVKEKYRCLQSRFENDQPQYEKLKQDLETERDVFQHKLNDVIVSHVSSLNQISKASDHAAQNAKWIHRVDERRDDDDGRRERVEQTRDERTEAYANLREKEKEIWEPST